MTTVGLIGLGAMGSGMAASLRRAGHKVQVFKGWQQVTPGTMSPAQFDQTIGDLVSYLQWMAEPAANTRIFGVVELIEVGKCVCSPTILCLSTVNKAKKE